MSPTQLSILLVDNGSLRVSAARVVTYLRKFGLGPTGMGLSEYTGFKAWLVPENRLLP